MTFIASCCIGFEMAFLTVIHLYTTLSYKYWDEQSQSKDWRIEGYEYVNKKLQLLTYTKKTFVSDRRYWIVRDFVGK